MEGDAVMDPVREAPPSLAALRAAVARLERPDGALRRRPGEDAPPPVRLGRGDLPLDAALGGGLRRGTLHEVVAADPRDTGAAAGFALALAGRAAGEGTLVWVVEDVAALEGGAPYAPGLAAHGLDPARLLIVRARDGRATLWAIEEALRLRAPAVLGELWSARHYGLAASRRLLLAAQAGGGTAILFQAGLPGRGALLSSAAATRFSIAACPSPRLASAGGRTPIPGPPAVLVHLLKRKLGAGTAADAPGHALSGLDRPHALAWNPDQRCFDAHALSVGRPALSGDGPAAPPRGAAVVPLRRAG